jgi:hypothetical protein
VTRRGLEHGAGIVHAGSVLLILGVVLALGALALLIGTLTHTRDVQNEERLARMPPRPTSYADQVWTPDTQAWEQLEHDDRDTPTE